MPPAPRRPAGRADSPEPTVEMRIHARLDGRGKAYHGERLLAEVEYALKDVDEVYEELVVGGGAGGQVVGPRTLYGVVQDPGAHALGGYVGARLTLELEDAGLLDFTVAKVLRADTFLIQGLGGVRRAS